MKIEYRAKNPAAEHGPKRGAILGVVLIVVLTVTTLGSGLIALSGTEAVEVSKAISATEAFWTAEAGLEFAKAISKKNPKPLENIPPFKSGELAGEINGNNFVVTYPYLVNWNNDLNRIKRYKVTSLGVSRSGVSRRVSEEAMTETFATYAHSSNFERTSRGSPIYFGGSDVIDGTVYVNDRLNIYGSPEFLRKAFTADSSVNYIRPTRTALDMSVFTMGLELGAKPLTYFDDDTDYIADVHDAAKHGGLVLHGTFQLTFLENGTIVHQKQDGSGAWHKGVTNDLSSGNGSIYVSEEAHVKGTVRGNITLAAESDIYITDDIIYASATAADHSDADFNEAVLSDVLGLIARNKVEIKRDSSIMRNDINIHAAILVTEGDGGFGCYRRYENLGEPNINMFGSISQYRRGIVGRLSSPPRGFAKNYSYDDRLLLDPPQWYPFSNYVYSGWRQEK
jgi:hypothetical protein